jgi:glycine cleavage system H lipoate-binding protein
MSCPFLCESRARYCRASGVRIPIPLRPQAETTERCLSPEWVQCRALPPAEFRPSPAGGNCPYLTDAAVQYCGAASRTPYIPFSEPSLTRCGSSAHRYCGLYLDCAGVPREEETGSEELLGAGEIYYAPNHMWLELAPDGLCHLGIDAFLARLLGSVDSITFLTSQGRHRPSAILTLPGLNLQLVFPGRVSITHCNSHLRSETSALTSSPYRRGWMFAGRDPELHGLMSGRAARLWMQNEICRVSEFVQRKQNAAADGGLFEPGIARRLTANEVLLLCTQFSPPPVDEGRF